jgi:hypothetical protein
MQGSAVLVSFNTGGINENIITNRFLGLLQKTRQWSAGCILHHKQTLSVGVRCLNHRASEEVSLVGAVILCTIRGQISVKFSPKWTVGWHRKLAAKTIRWVVRCLVEYFRWKSLKFPVSFSCVPYFLIAKYFSFLNPWVIVYITASILVSKVCKDTHVCAPYCPSKCAQSEYAFILIQRSRSMPSSWKLHDGNSTAVDSTNERRANLGECNACENRSM